MKVCKVCKRSLPETDYSKHTKERLRSTCKVCRAVIAKEKYSKSDKQEVMRKYRQYRETRWISHRANYLITAAKQRAKTKNLIFDLDPYKAEIQEIINKGVCQVTGIPFDMSARQRWNSPSLDRINPIEGYVRQNVRVVLFSLNVMMHDWGLDCVREVMTALNKKENL